MKKRRPLILLALLGALAALVVAGCGDDGETTSTPTAASGATGATGDLTPDQWATQADEICKQGDQAQDVAIKGFFEDEGISQNQQPTDAQLEQLTTDVVIPNIESQIDGVATLPRPEESADQIQEFVDQANSDLDTLKSDPGLLNTQGNPFEETQKLASDLGLKECAS